MLMLDAHRLDAAVRRRLAMALVLGGLVAGGLFYFHYLPGMVGGVRGMSVDADPFPAEPSSSSTTSPGRRSVCGRGY